jgi:uncharacterized membrane protein YkoI
MQRRTKIITAVAAGLLLAGGGVATAAALGEDEAEGPDVAITGDALERAGEAALEHTGGGEVTDTEVGDEESYYEVEVTLPDGSEIDVQLDQQFRVVGDEAEDGESEGGESDEGGG